MKEVITLSIKKIISGVLIFIGVISIMIIGLGESVGAVEKEISILLTGDMHSHLETQTINQGVEMEERGGFAKIKTIKDRVEEEYKGTFLLDAGDFSMGTPFQSIFRTDAAELKAMAEIGYDAVAIGNHEFDYKAEGLADMLGVAKEYKPYGGMMPAVLIGNINWQKTLGDKEMREGAKKLENAFKDYGVADYTIIEKNGVRMAVFAVMGDEAISNAPEAGIAFDNYILKSKKIVKEIKRNADADIIVALSHSGLDEKDFKESEDVKLAQEVSGIDVIVSGHSHTKLIEPRIVEDTTIVASGEYANDIGHLVLEKNGEKYKVKKHNIISLDKNVNNDEDIEKLISDFKKIVDTNFFKKYGYKYDQVLASNEFQFTTINKFAEEQKEDSLANIITDSYIYAVENVEKNRADRVDVAVVPAGVVRASLKKGNITVADAFNISSLGTGPDGGVGYPIVSIYLTGKELRAMAEVDASVSPGMNEARLYTSGMGYTINEKRLFLNRATDIRLIDREGKETEDIKGDKLYRVVGGLYSCQMLSIVKEQSSGLLSIEPKDKDGNVIKNFDKHIVRMDDGRELKEWYAIASYIDSFAQGKVPEYYNSTHERKLMDNSLNPIKLLKQPNRIGVMFISLILIPIVIITGFVVFVVKRRNKRRGFAKSMFSGGRRYSNTLGSRGRKPAIKSRKLNMKKRSNRKRW